VSVVLRELCTLDLAIAQWDQERFRRNKSGSIALQATTQRQDAITNDFDKAPAQQDTTLADQAAALAGRLGGHRGHFTGPCPYAAMGSGP
jgi:hypothetical protein